MIHQYKLNGYNIVLDVDSGAVHAVDDLAYDVIELVNEYGPEMPRRELAEKITHEQENSIAMAGEGGRINITMALAWNNHFHGWTQAREIIHRDGGAALDSGSWKSRFLGDSGQEKPGISAQVAPLLPENTEE